MARRKGRILAFQALYSWEAGAVDLESLLKFSWVSKERIANMGEDSLAFARLITGGTIENIAEIDALINSHLVNWDFSRLNKVDLALLRISVYSLIYQTEIHSSIVIAEAVSISREFGSDDAFRFINGILGAIKMKVGLKGENAADSSLKGALA